MIELKFIRKLFFLLPFIGTYSTTVSAQFGFAYNDSIEVINGSDTLKNPWAGGLNYAQFSDFDFDFDGDLDLFVFDRSSDNIRVYTQEVGPTGPFYKYFHDAKQFFPSDLKHRAQLIDYDNDGLKDIFTWGLGGLKVYRNVSDSINGLQWTLFQDIVYSQYAVSGYTNLAISANDIPAIVDVDFDGDIDILTTDLGGPRVEYHKNLSMELYGIPDSLVFIQKNECWGKFSESPTSSVIILNDPNSPCTGGNITNPENSEQNTNRSQHSGATILAIDIDSSGVLDLIMGDDSYNNLTLLINGGTTVNSDSPMISFDDAFPSYTTPVKCYLFPAAFYIDVDFDGLKDLVASPNSVTNSFNQSSVFFYKNIGTNALPVFTPVSTNFLQAEMIEHGSGSIPVLFDYNEDGLKDLIVSNFYRYKPIGLKESTVAYYENIGSANQPRFKFVDDDIFNLSQQTLGLNTVPTFGDIDNDGDEDLFLGLEDGTLVYHENLSTGTGFVLAPGIYNYQDDLSNPISAGSHCHPQLFDLNNDGLLDLVLGSSDGTIKYYQNMGTANSPSFSIVNSNLGNVDFVPTNQSEKGTPHFFRVNNETKLFGGSIEGKLIYYDNIDNNLAVGNNFNLVSDNYLGLDVDGYSSFYVFDLDGDSSLNMFVGQDLGGITHYEAIPGSNVNLAEKDILKFSLFPNPADQSITINSEVNIIKIELIDMQGRSIASKVVSSNTVMVDVSTIDFGIYNVVIQTESGQLGSKKLIIH